MPGGHHPRCLGPRVTTYADRAMPADELRQWDRHLVACECCRRAVEEERQVLAALRRPAAPSMPGELRAMLLSLADLPATAETGGGAEEPPRRHLPLPRHAPTRETYTALPVVQRSAPPLHRSLVRATVFAGLAAGASAAAAWSLAMGGSALAPPAPAEAPAPPSTGPRSAVAEFLVPGATAPGAALAATTLGSTTLGSSALGTATLGTAVLGQWAARPAVGTVLRHSAESAP